MAKRKSGLSFWLMLVAIACGVASICMMFVNSVKITGYSTNEYLYTGYQATIGFTDERTNISQLNFSFLNLLPYILLVVAVIIAVLAMLGITKGKIVKFVVCGLFVVSGILFFCEGQFVVLGDLFNNSISGAFGSLTGSEITRGLTTGAIVAGVSSLVGAVATLVAALKD